MNFKPFAILLLLAGAASASPKLALSPCNLPGLPEDARCGTYEVFENRAARTGRKIPLRVALIPANVADKEPDAITFFAGGPGESAVADGGWLAEVIRARGPQTRDLLLVDLRGTGQSAPLVCPELEGTRGVQGFLDDFLPVESVRSCREKLSRTADLTRYTTEAGVDDFDEVRAALGYETVNVVAGSYGSRTAQVYMRRHPSRVRTATLFGILPTGARMPLDFARSAQNALDGWLAECAGDAGCRAAFPRLREEVAEVLLRVEKEPVRIELIDPGTAEPFELRLDRNGLAQTLRYVLYNPATAVQLPLAVHLAAQGDFRPLAENARVLGSSSAVNGYTLSITCAEDIPFIREEEIPAAVVGTFLGDFRIRRQQDACKVWPAARLGPEFLAPTVSDTPTLLVSGERDPVNPPSYAEQVVRHLRHGIHVVIPDGAHVNGGMKGGDCAYEMMGKLIETGSTDRLDTSCLARMERPAFALSPGDPEVVLSAADLERLTGTYRESRGGFEARLDIVGGIGGERLRARYSDGSADLFVPTSATRFRTLSGGYSLVFRMEGGRAASLLAEQSGEPLGEEMLRVPSQTALQKLALSPCNTPGLPADALCGTYEVFENRAAHTGRKILLRVMLVPANVPKKEPDAITFFAGGPGESAVADGGWLAEVIRARGPQTRDLLLVDLRGTGKSAPLNCPSLSGAQSIQGFLDDFMPAEGVRACREELSRTADLTQYTSEIAVDDVDEVRAALGYEKLNVVGASYGTRTAQVYMRRHPSRVRTSTLFVTLPNDARTPLDFARSAQNALDGLIAECAGDAACHSAFPRLKEEIDQILRQTEKEAVRVRVVDPDSGKPLELRLNRDGVAQVLRYLLYNTDRAAQLPLFVHLAAQGDFGPFAEMARAWGDYNWSDGYFLAITCAEDVPFIREEEIPAAVAGTFLGAFRIRRQQAACKAWSAARLGPEFLAPTVSDAPTLLLSGERDPVTPPRYAEAVLRHLRNGVHVVIPDGAHSNGGMKGSNDCEWRMMVKLIEAGTAEGFDGSCAARMERPAFALGMAPEVTLAEADLERLTGTYRESRGGFEARLEVLAGIAGIGGKRLRARYSDGTAALFVPISPTRFRTANDGYNLVFRLEGGRAAALTMEQAGQPVGGEMRRVP